MSRPFKFRYANEIAGGFVLLTLALFVGGVFLAGQSQGWFEGKFDLTVDFDSAEGSFGLQEGDEVWVMNTVAGRVEKIEPKASGGMRGALVLQNRYLPLISVDSVARVKRKFGLAGDAYVEIDVGTGTGIVDGATIPGMKDEEIMETARKMLKDLERDVMPMLEDSRQIVEHVNTISGAIATGDGLAGAAIHDEAMTAEVKTMLHRVNTMILNSDEAIRETTKLIQGVQRHWLIRKYIKDTTPEIVLSVSQIEPDQQGRLAREWAEGIEAGRVGNSPGHIIANALNLAYLNIETGDLDRAESWLAEARFELARNAEDPSIRSTLVEAELALHRGDPERALALLSDEREPGWGDPRAERAAWLLCKARAFLQAGEMDKAQENLEQAAHQARKSEMGALEGDAAHLAGRLALARKEGVQAAAAFDRAAECFRQAGLYGVMSRELMQAGAVYEDAGQEQEAFDRYCRAARSRMAAGGDAEALIRAARRVGATLPNWDAWAQLDFLNVATDTME